MTFEQARQLGPLALLRLRAEVLLKRMEEGPSVPVTEEDREHLVRIASAPQLSDREFLGRFDFIFEQDEGL